jgi:hypothetical protein
MSESTWTAIVPVSDKTTRRDFLYIATATFGALGAAAWMHSTI